MSLFIRCSACKCIKPIGESSRNIDTGKHYCDDCMNGKTPVRPSWDSICMNTAIELAKRSTCKTPDRQVGCVIVTSDYSSIEAWGYNGGPAGIDDTCDFNPDVKVGSRCNCAHAEMNAISKLDSTKHTDLILYVTLQPCMLCATLIVNTKSISKVVYLDEYRDKRPLFILEEAGLKVRKFEP